MICSLEFAQLTLNLFKDCVYFVNSCIYLNAGAVLEILKYIL